MDFEKDSINVKDIIIISCSLKALQENVNFTNELNKIDLTSLDKETIKQNILNSECEFYILDDNEYNYMVSEFALPLNYIYKREPNTIKINFSITTFIHSVIVITDKIVKIFEIRFMAREDSSIYLRNIIDGGWHHV